MTLTTTCMTLPCEPNLGQVWAAAFRAFGAAVQASLLAVIVWQERARERRLLAELDDAALKDMGLTPGDVMRELDKMQWPR